MVELRRAREHLVKYTGIFHYEYRAVFTAISVIICMTVCVCLLYAAIVYCYHVFAGGWFDFRFERSLRFHAMRA